MATYMLVPAENVNLYMVNEQTNELTATNHNTAYNNNSFTSAATIHNTTSSTTTSSANDFSTEQSKTSMRIPLGQGIPGYITLYYLLSGDFTSLIFVKTHIACVIKRSCCSHWSYS